jgi:hypothetical protein
VAVEIISGCHQQPHLPPSDPQHIGLRVLHLFPAKRNSQNSIQFGPSGEYDVASATSPVHGQMGSTLFGVMGRYGGRVNSLDPLSKELTLITLSHLSWPLVLGEMTWLAIRRIPASFVNRRCCRMHQNRASFRGCVHPSRNCCTTVITTQLLVTKAFTVCPDCITKRASSCGRRLTKICRLH